MFLGSVLVCSGEWGTGADSFLLAAGNIELLCVRRLDSSLESLHKKQEEMSMLSVYSINNKFRRIYKFMNLECNK